MKNITISFDDRHAATLEENAIHKPYAIFQFGPNSTRYEVLPSVCPRYNRCCSERHNIKNEICDKRYTALCVTGSSTSTITIEVHHG